MEPMDNDTWTQMTQAERERWRERNRPQSETYLTPQLRGLEGWRVEVVDDVEGATPRRFYVGRSCGWCPCHIELKRVDSSGGVSAWAKYRSVRKLYKRRDR